MQNVNRHGIRVLAGQKYKMDLTLPLEPLYSFEEQQQMIQRARHEAAHLAAKWQAEEDEKVAREVERAFAAAEFLAAAAREAEEAAISRLVTPVPQKKFSAPKRESRSSQWTRLV